MAENSDSSLQKRVERLEAVVAELQDVLKKSHETSGIKNHEVSGNIQKSNDQKQTELLPDPNKQFQASSRPSKKAHKLPDHMKTSEYWLNKIGISLLLFGLAFLFKYSIDQGWLIPPVRIGFGIFLGLFLVSAGIRISNVRKQFSQVLSGGGIATFYITGFAAFQLFNLIPFPIAFAFMVIVTLLSFFLSLKQDGVSLAIIASIGGLGTPFLLYTDSGNIPGLVIYTCLIVSGTSAIYFYRGWTSLLWTYIIGGWLVLLIALNQGIPNGSEGVTSDRLALQLGIVFSWLIFWILPLTRAFVCVRNPERWIPYFHEDTDKPHSQFTGVILHQHLHWLSFSLPIIALWMSMGIWSLSNQTWGWCTFGLVLVYGVTSWRLSVLKPLKEFSLIYSLVSIVFLTYAFYLLLDGNTLIFVLAAEAATLHFLALRFSDKKTAITAHLLFGIVGIWLIQRLLKEHAQGTVLFNIQAMTDLWVIVMAFVVSIRAKFTEEKQIYRFLVHLFILGWFLRELVSLPNGQGYVTIAWGIYSLILLITGLRMNWGRVRTIAMGTILIVVGKLFLVDLAELETIWRVLLFLGFGGLLLILSYYFQALWKSNERPSAS
jgi:uncharacterized membrane protein